MPELPDVTVYVEHLALRLVGARFERARVASPNLLRTVDPPLEAGYGRTVRGVLRLGKRIVLELDGGLFLVIHLMIAGRFHWKEPGSAAAARAPKPASGAAGAKAPNARPRAGLGRYGLASFEFSSGTLTLTESSTRQRAALYVVQGEAALARLDPGGVEPLGSSVEAFHAALTRENHTLKRGLTDPRLFSGIGNAYSDEILHRARLSPLQLTRNLDADEVARLHRAVQDVLVEWTDRIRAHYGARFPEKVTAFRPEMAVHGRYKLPCPVCGTPVQRIVYAEHETNYCARCQTGGVLLRDRALSRLLHDDWPKTLEEKEG